MNDNWFDEHMFEIAAPKSYLTEEMTAALESTPVLLPAWDPMGSLASEEGCGDSM
jgi:bleomycin hydrolase